MVNGEEPSSPTATAKKDTIMITGKIENCEEAKKALLVSKKLYYTLLFVYFLQDLTILNITNYSFFKQSQ
jgi:hypothetical protein